MKYGAPKKFFFLFFFRPDETQSAGKNRGKFEKGGIPAIAGKLASLL